MVWVSKAGGIPGYTSCRELGWALDRDNSRLDRYSSNRLDRNNSRLDSDRLDHSRVRHRGRERLDRDESSVGPPPGPDLHTVHHDHGVRAQPRNILHHMH